MKFLLDSPQLRRPRLQIKMTYGDIVRDIVDLSGSDDNSLESGSFQDDYPSPQVLPGSHCAALYWEQKWTFAAQNL